MHFAPIAIFAFKRPQHTKRMLESLSRNSEFLHSPVFIYCDGPRNDADLAQVEETRKLVRGWPHPNKTVVERDRNWGLASSVIAGVSELCERYGSVIVVEDDLVVSPAFLNYLNTALERFADHHQVMQVSAHMFPVFLRSKADAVMLPFATSWGWATWNRAWRQFDPEMRGYDKLKGSRTLRKRFDLDGSYPYFRMLKRQARGSIDSWAIRWNLSVFMADGLVLYPKQTLVLNEGFDGSGSNCKTPHLKKENLRVDPIVELPEAKISEQDFAHVKKYLRGDQSVLNKVVRHGRALWTKYLGK